MILVRKSILILNNHQPHCKFHLFVQILPPEQINIFIYSLISLFQEDIVFDITLAHFPNFQQVFSKESSGKYSPHHDSLLCSHFTLLISAPELWFPPFLISLFISLSCFSLIPSYFYSLFVLFLLDSLSFTTIGKKQVGQWCFVKV